MACFLPIKQLQNIQGVTTMKFQLFKLLRPIVLAGICFQVIAAPLPDLSGGQIDRIEYQSISPGSRWDYIRGVMANTKDAVVYADFLMPKNVAADAKVPAVVLSHGSGGVESNMFDVWAKELNAAGYAVFIPYTYKSRGVSDTQADQGAVQFPADVADAMNALRMLSTHPKIDAKRIYNMGFSRGGSVAFTTAWPSWQDPVDTKGVKFAGHIAWYPGNCNNRFRTDDREQSTAPTFVLLAERDLEEGADVAVCRRWYDELVAKGNKITYKEYKGARHGFDGLNFWYRTSRGISSAKNCDMEVYPTTKKGSGVGNNGFDFKTNTALPTWKEFETSRKACVQDGNIVGTRGGGNAKEVQAESVKDALDFLKILN
jgi:dienelactone hydrolase